MASPDVYQEKELFERIKLCGSKGSLNPNAIGWSRNQIFDCNLNGRWARKKKWNYWAVMNQDCMFSVTVSSLDYAGLVFLYFYDYRSGYFMEKTYTLPFAKGCVLSDTVGDDVVFFHKDIHIEMLRVVGGVHITTSCLDFGGKRIDADLQVLYPEGYETLNVVIPWNDKTFQFTSKHEGMSVEGTILYDGHSYSLDPDSAFACLDFGRGIWPRRVFWNWANASGIASGRRIGVNLGAGWTAGTGMTENALVVDGKLYKLSEDVEFLYDKSDYKKPWHIKTTASDAVDLVFTPAYERLAHSNMVLVASDLHQMICHVSGVLKPPGLGEVIEVNGLQGCAEDHYAKW